MAFQGGGAPRFAVGTVVSNSLTIVSHNLFRFLGIIVVVGVPAVLLLTVAAMMLSSGVRSAGTGGSLDFANNASAMLFFIVASAVSLAAYFLIQAAITHAALQTLRGRQATVAAALRQALAALPRLFLAGLLLFVLGAILAGIAGTVLGTLRGGPDGAPGGGPEVVLVALVILAAALGFGVMIWVFVPAILVERLGPIAGLLRSFALTKGRRWPIFGIVILLVIANVAVSILTRLLMQSGAPLGGAVLNVLAALFFMAFSTVLSAVGYYYLRAEKEGVAIEDVVKVFD